MIKHIVGILAVISISSISIAEVQQVSPEEQYDEQHRCMALNIYHEARAESKLGQQAVGFVTLNRVYDSRYPNTVCDVVYQSHVDSRGNPIRNKCQFSWYCDGKSDKPHDQMMWVLVQEVAHQVLHAYDLVEDFTEGATMYHASYINPYWAPSYEKTVRIDNHIFYK
jgi:N-acetylmuramoyl-L-alanine amidase